MAFLTKESAEPVKSHHHHKAMPMILTAQQEPGVWMRVHCDEAKALRHPLLDNMLSLV